MIGDLCVCDLMVEECGEWCPDVRYAAENADGEYDIDDDTEDELL